jgi:hypothetical protein
LPGKPIKRGRGINIGQDAWIVAGNLADRRCILGEQIAGALITLQAGQLSEPRVGKPDWVAAPTLEKRRRQTRAAA